MDPEAQKILRSLLTERRVLALAVEVDDTPHAGLLPFVVRPDFAGLLVHASGLARHSQGLSDGAPCGLVIHLPEREDLDPLQLPRLTLDCTVRHLAKGGADYEEGREQYLGRFPGSAMTFGLGDFELYDLVPRRGRLVTGFASAANVGPETLRKLAP